jgi:SAM-dependent methyltransferase
VIGQIEDLLRAGGETDKLTRLKSRAENLRSGLEAIDSAVFHRLRAVIRAGGDAGGSAGSGKGFKNLIGEYVDFSSGGDDGSAEAGYDNLDILINGVTSFLPMPEQTRDLEPEMVYYQKTPARIVFELVEKAHFLKGDVFFDVGSGLGQVAMLVNLLTGVRAIGVEFEPAFCRYARECAAQLNLSGVRFDNVDAREADFSEGTVFFLYTPFRGEILRNVLEVLKKESLERKIRLITYGPCTAQVALESWLEGERPGNPCTYKLGFFSS